MEFLQESRDLLKIEDILPFFPDFVTIDHFKDALCESLAEYNKQIDVLKVEFRFFIFFMLNFFWKFYLSQF